MQAQPILMVTQNAALWQHWQQINSTRWKPVLGNSLQDMQRWALQSGQIVMLDASLSHLPDWNAADWTPLLQNLKVLVLNTRPSDNEGRLALGRGAYGYAHAYTPTASLNTILNSIDEGSIWLGRSLMQRLLQDIGSRLPEPGTKNKDWASDLSPREQEVARLAGVGQSNSDIAEHLGVSERTVRAHLSSIFEKLHVSDRLMLALKVHGIG